MSDEKDSGGESPPFPSSLNEILESEFNYSTFNWSPLPSQKKYWIINTILFRLQRPGRVILIVPTRKAKEEIKRLIETRLGAQPMFLRYHILEEDINES